tara:strand:+ start:1255 stop:1464 length:210 start_codon:yes stop_codon:yes gene_type:complete
LVQELISLLNPEKNKLQRCIKFYQDAQIIEFNQWANHTINLYLTIRYITAFYVKKEFPKVFISSRKEAE